MGDSIEVARALAPLVCELAANVDVERRLPYELVDELVRAGLMHLVLPEAYGGSETDPITAARVVEEVALADGSTGWCVMLAAQTGGFAGMVEPTVVREVWGSGRILAGAARPWARR